MRSREILGVTVSSADRKCLSSTSWEPMSSCRANMAASWHTDAIYRTEKGDSIIIIIIIIINNYNNNNNNITLLYEGYINQ